MTHLYEYEVHFEDDPERDTEIVETVTPPSAAEDSLLDEYPTATRVEYVGRVA